MDLTTYSISLFFNKKSQDYISQLIEEISCNINSSYFKDRNIPPHITVGMFKSDRNNLDLLVKKVSYFEKSFTPFELNIESYDTFRNKLIFLKPDEPGCNQLKLINRKLYDLLSGDFEPACNGLYIPDMFFPHLSLASGVTKTELNKLEPFFSNLPYGFKLNIEKFSLAQVHPYKVVINSID